MTLMESISRNISRWEGRGGRGDVGGGSGECEYAGEKKGGHLCIYIYMNHDMKRAKFLSLRRV